MTDARPMFQSIRDTRRATGLPECFLRKLVKEGRVPGVYSGKKFLVNVPALLEQLEREGAGGGVNGVA